MTRLQFMLEVIFRSIIENGSNEVGYRLRETGSTRLFTIETYEAEDESDP